MQAGQENTWLQVRTHSEDCAMQQEVKYFATRPGLFKSIFITILLAFHCVWAVANVSWWMSWIANKSRAWLTLKTQISGFQRTLLFEVAAQVTLFWPNDCIVTEILQEGHEFVIKKI